MTHLTQIFRFKTDNSFFMNGVILSFVLIIASAVTNLAYAQDAPTAKPHPDETKIVQFNLKILKTAGNPLETRKMSAGLLMDLTTPGVNDQLLTILEESTDPQTKLAIIYAIADRDEPSAIFIKPMMSILLGTDQQLVDAVSVALGRYRNSELNAQLISIASDPKRMITQRLPAIKTLGKIRTKETLEALLKIMEKAPETKNNQAEIESACSRSLFELTHNDFGIDLSAWKAWWESNKNKTTTQWLESQLDMVTSENRILLQHLEETERALIDTIGRLYQLSPTGEADRIKLLQSYLTGPLPAERQAGLEILLALISPKQPIPANLKATIQNLINDPDPDVRMACAKALAMIGDGQIVDKIFTQMEAESSPEVKQVWLLAIGQLGDENVLQKLIPQLNSPFEPVSVGAAKAIAKIFQTQKTLSSEIKDQVIQSLLKRYQQIGPEQWSFRQELLATMTDENVADIRFLQIFKAELTSKNAETRRFAAKGIASLRDEKLANLLIGRLNDPEPSVRAELATGIASITSSNEAVQSLLDRITTNLEKDNQVRQTTWNAIITMTGRWSIDEQLAWATQLANSKTAVQLNLLNQLIDLLNKDISQQSASWSADQKINIAVNFSSLLLKVDRPEDAMKYFRQAIAASRQLKPEKSIKLTEQLLSLLLDNTKSEIFISEYLNSLADILDTGQLLPVMDQFIDWTTKEANKPIGVKTYKLFSKELLAKMSDASKTKLSDLTKPPATKPAPVPATKPTPSPKSDTRPASQPAPVATQPTTKPTTQTAVKPTTQNS